MKVRSQRYGRWVALAALALAVAAIVAPTGVAMPLGGHPCVPQCGSFETQTVGVPLAGGPSVAELAEYRNAEYRNSVEQVASPPLSELEKSSFDGPGTANPRLEPLYPVVAPLSGPESVPTTTPHRVPLTFDQPAGEPGTDWPAVGFAAGLGALVLIGGAMMIVGMNRRRPPLANA
jgi:hypothetical protein